MGLVTPLIQFCRVISSGMVQPSCSQSSETFFWYFLVVYGRPLCFPFNVTLIVQYALYIIFLKALHLPSGEGVLPHYTLARGKWKSLEKDDT